MDKFENFHYLIEIGLKLEEHMANYEQYPSPNTKKSIYYYRIRLKKWLDENYHDPGINKVKENRLLSECN